MTSCRHVEVLCRFFAVLTAKQEKGHNCSSLKPPQLCFIFFFLISQLEVVKNRHKIYISKGVNVAIGVQIASNQIKIFNIFN